MAIRGPARVLCLMVADPYPAIPIGQLPYQNAPLDRVPGAVSQALPVPAQGGLAGLSDHDLALARGKVDGIDVESPPVRACIINRKQDPPRE